MGECVCDGCALMLSSAFRASSALHLRLNLSFARSVGPKCNIWHQKKRHTFSRKICIKDILCLFESNTLRLVFKQIIITLTYLLVTLLSCEAPSLHYSQTKHVGVWGISGSHTLQDFVDCG